MCLASPDLQATIVSTRLLLAAARLWRCRLLLALTMITLCGCVVAETLMYTDTYDVFGCQVVRLQWFGWGSLAEFKQPVAWKVSRLGEMSSYILLCCTVPHVAHFLCSVRNCCCTRVLWYCAGIRQAFAGA
jgi:hypothetical protein